MLTRTLLAQGSGLWAAEQLLRAPKGSAVWGGSGTHPKYISQLPTATQHSSLQDVKLEAIKESKTHHFLMLQGLGFYSTSKYTLKKYTQKVLVHKNASIDIKCNSEILMY